jgi:hypothetical protein
MRGCRQVRIRAISKDCVYPYHLAGEKYTGSKIPDSSLEGLGWFWVVLGPNTVT